jgi:hypothetical protein
MIVKGGMIAALAPKPGPIDGGLPPISDHGEEIRRIPQRM